MQLLKSLIDFVLHLDVHLAAMTATYGLLTYAILFAIIFAETGLVIMPFLPGDSLLFAAGALCALGSLNIFVVWLSLVFAAILGDTVNYWVGKIFGDRIIKSKHIPFINQEHIAKTEAFYEKHGGVTIILARFIPIIRTFAPFVAGVGKMHYHTFVLYNIVGALIWVTLFTLAGYFFGNIPWVKHNFEIVIFVIIGLSVLPMIYEYLKHRMKKS